MPLFVIHPRLHTLLRFIAVFVIGPLMWHKGRQYKDNLLMLLGLATILVDGYTLFQSLKKIESEEKP